MIGGMIRDFIKNKSILKSVLRNQINHINQKNQSTFPESGETGLTRAASVM